LTYPTLYAVISIGWGGEMDPITIAILVVVAQQIGGHYVNKILDKADKRILQAIGTTPEGPDLSKLREYLESNPEAEKKVRSEAVRYSVHAMVIPPPDALLTSDDKVELYAATLNMVIDVITRQKRAVVLRGFFNHVEALVFFDYRSDLRPLTVTHGMIDLGPRKNAIADIYVHSGVEAQWAFLFANEDIRMILQAQGYASFDDMPLKKKFCSARNRVMRIYADYMIFDPERYGRKKVTRLIDLDQFPGSERAFHQFFDPYAGIETMVSYLLKEAQTIFLSKSEIKKFRALLKKLKASDILGE